MVLFQSFRAQVTAWRHGMFAKGGFGMLKGWLKRVARRGVRDPI